MTSPIIDKNIHFQVNRVLKKYNIEAKLVDINRLSTIVHKSILFNQKLYKKSDLVGVSLAMNVENLIEIFILRSEVYREMNYSSEFPERIQGLDFDEYDSCSAIIYTKRKGIITGTCRLIFDSLEKKLPIDKKFSLDYLRKQNRKLGEASRVIVRNRKGLKQEFKLLTIDYYRILASYKMDSISVMTEEHLKMYRSFGGFQVEKEFQDYGSIKKLFLITIWDISKISPLFKRVFLRNVA